MTPGHSAASLASPSAGSVLCRSANSKSSMAVSSADVPAGKLVKIGLRRQCEPGRGFGMRFLV
jgi:hypothetical protein